MRNARGQQGKNELKNKSEEEHSNKIFGEQTRQFLHKN